MSKITAWMVWLVLLIAMAACQGPTASDNESATTDAAIADAEPPEEAPDADGDAAAEQMQQFRALGRLGAKRGLLEKTEAATPGYVLFNPIISAEAYLIDKDGQVVHMWKTGLGASGGVYLRDNGNLFRPTRNAKAPVFAGGGQGGRFQEYTWDGEVAWDVFFGSEKFIA